MENKDAIPRLFWFHKDSSLFDIFKQVIFQYSFAQDLNSHRHNPVDFFSDWFSQLEEFLKNPETNSFDEGDLQMDQTRLPFVLNVMNPNYVYSSYRQTPDCRNCGGNNCKVCPLPILKSLTLRQLLDQVVNAEKFQNNTNLYKSKEEMKSSYNDGETGGFIGGYSNQYSIQDSSDED